MSGSGRGPGFRAALAACGACKGDTRRGAARRRFSRCPARPRRRGSRPARQRMMRSWSAWMVATMSPIRPVRPAAQRRQQGGLPGQVGLIDGVRGRARRRPGSRPACPRCAGGGGGSRRTAPAGWPGRTAPPPGPASRPAAARDRRCAARAGRYRTGRRRRNPAARSTGSAPRRRAPRRGPGTSCANDSRSDHPWSFSAVGPSRTSASRCLRDGPQHVQPLVQHRHVSLLLRQFSRVI